MDETWLDRVCEMIEATALGEWAFNPETDLDAEPEKLRLALAKLMRRVSTLLRASERAALTDPATALDNSVGFRRLVEAAIHESGATSPVGAIIYLGLDSFRKINDRLDLWESDRLLQAIAGRLRLAADWCRELRPTGPAPIIARLAGDEFGIFCSGALTADDLEELATRCLRLLAEPFDLDGGTLPATLTASAGAARMPHDARIYERLMAKAGMAMHQAKARGGNQVCLCDPQIIERAQDCARLEAELRLAADRGELEFAFQPKLPTRPDVRPSVEALVRWRHPQRGMLLPGSFLPLAEEAGFLVQIGRWTLLEGMRVAADWARQDMPCLLSLNITVQDIRQPDFVDFVRASLAQTGASPELLEFEVTESMLMEDSPIFVERLLEVRSLGIRIAIDDFGTGYSNWARMLLLPIDCIKIDRSLVTDLATRRDYQTVVRTFVSLADGLGFEVVAEGVETAAQAEMLKEMGCDALQGYAIARPLNEADALAWLRCPRMAGLPVAGSDR
ncbi:diguanylate cyclase (GGDEF)-like protein [Sphingobium sp. B2D3A]|uniref:putative bifunctional diguanylate cyclase/phosphodiesterase n=1 Tax=unclassified Sphingobium TaxID=2611147 RepID=UPI002224C4EB|nr:MULTISPECIES: bifunctional diguanylate cyclase/phosphodiesterase [unclassified Sphingobium]MCW2339151.1 diguanylate cyclase (GGDEF)-like protein [Sphingobium sp. B2D3A]MCW2386905.1 diguanylate cyclase (GGDEF)-like protein [Sphingobium sp. B2D3D]